MKKFKDGDNIDCNMLEEGEIIKFENHYLKVKKFEGVGNPCDYCFFKYLKYCNLLLDCSIYTTPDGYGNQELDYEVIFEEISEIEAMILTGDEYARV